MGVVKRLALRRRDQQVADADDAAGELGSQLAMLRDPELFAGLGLHHCNAAVLAVCARAGDLVSFALPGVEGDRVGPALHRAGGPPLFEPGAFGACPCAPLANGQLAHLGRRARFDQLVVDGEVEQNLEDAQDVVRRTRSLRLGVSDLADVPALDVRDTLSPVLGLQQLGDALRAGGIRAEAAAWSAPARP